MPTRSRCMQTSFCHDAMGQTLCLSFRHFFFGKSREQQRRTDKMGGIERRATLYTDVKCPFGPLYEAEKVPLSLLLCKLFEIPYLLLVAWRTVTYPPTTTMEKNLLRLPFFSQPSNFPSSRTCNKMSKFYELADGS